MNVSFDFAGKVVLITGAAGNLGAALAEAFHAAGATLVLAERNLEKLQEIAGNWINTLLLPVDLLDEASVQQMAAAAVAQYGRIDALANIAGGFTMGPPLHETELKTWEFMLNLNARSVFLVCRAVIPHMLAQGAGKIVNVAARAGLSGGARMAPYSVSKSAVIRLTESMAAELKGHNINVNCVMPGTIDTPQNRVEMPNADWSRWVTPEAIARVILFLAADDAAAIQGAAVPVYGRG
ncbi:MAG: SDR family NAD(P)-dependent oxidoreductase [Candidatus Promineifilaceae bacterium]